MSANPLPLACRRSRRHVLGSAVAVVAMAAGGVPGLARAAHVVRSWSAAKPVPTLDLAGLDGSRWRLEAAAGQVVVLNFWATWCEPCRTEMPSLQAMAASTQRDGVVVVAVNYRESADVIRRFLERLPFKVPILLDSDGDVTTAWTPRVFPSTVLVGRDGVPVHTVLGELDWDGAEARALLGPMVAVPRRRTRTVA